MNERVASLRQASLDAKPCLTAERAVLITRFYQNDRTASIPRQRALAFKYIFENKTIWIGDQELIVGERGPFPKATPTCPELCCHSLNDLDILNSRPKTWYLVDAEARNAYEEIVIPYWQGRTMRERIFEQMSDEWKAAYDAGLFTEFMEQRAPGHTVLDGKIYHKGMLDFIADIDRSLATIDDLNDPEAYQKREELAAMRICAEAIITYAQRHAEQAKKMAAVETNPLRRAELEKIAAVCTRVPAHKPNTFWEALQYYWFIHLGVITELNPWDAFNPGRLDQHLYPFYRQGRQDGSLTEDQARELLQCFWIKFNNQPAPPKVGVTAEESGTYTDFANINSGGLKPDGSDGVNDLSYIVLDVIDEMKLLQPSSNIQLSKKNPDRFLKHALRIVRKGWGQPSMFNTDAVVEELVRQGKLLEDARDGGNSGCVESGAFGKEAFILTGYLNLPKIFEITLNNGLDPRTGQQLGPATGDPAGFTTFEQLLEAFRVQLQHFVDIKVRGNNIIETLFARYMPVPFLSLLIDDCIVKGQDYHCGGARYNSRYIQGVGIGTLTDCLSAIKHHVFEWGTFTMGQLLDALKVNFAGQEKMRQTILNKSPRYGNDDDRADDLMRTLFQTYYAAVNGRKTMNGGTYRINMLPTTCHIYFGSVMGASADGRLAGVPVSEGISPVQGADRQGPTGVIKSAAKMDHIKTGGTLLNQKFTPQLLEGQEGINHLAALVRTYFRLDGHHIQFNVIRAETLRDAQAHPDQYRDLIVRVAGYSDYFCDLSQALQDEIIARTEHTGF